MIDQTGLGSTGSIRVKGSAVGSALITGNGNVVTIVYAADVLRARPLGANPYRGLSAFDEASSHLFFGRERVVAALIQRLARLTAPSSARSTRLLTIIGPSGCGKSSVARAGLIPALARAEQSWLREPRVAILRPGPSPLEALADALARLATGQPNPIEERQRLASILRKRTAADSFDGLSEIARHHPPSRPLIVLVDQFEEVYTLCRPLDPSNKQQAQATKRERDAFCATLLRAAAEPNGSVSVLITLRSDFYGALAEHPELSSAVAESSELVPAMGRDDLRRAVSEPARAEGHPIDDSTLARILDEAVGEIGALPLVQFALERIWERMRDGIAPADTLAVLGGIGGALASRADEVFDASSEQATVKRALLTTVQLSEEASHDTRRRAWLEEIVPANVTEEKVRRALEPFVEARLLATGATEGRIWFELPHETLIRHWITLQKWIDSEREDLRFRRRFGEAAQEYIKGKGQLWRGPNLTQLSALAHNHADELSTSELKFWRRSLLVSRFYKSVVTVVAISITLLGCIGGLEIIKEHFSRTRGYNNYPLEAGETNPERRSILPPRPDRPALMLTFSGGGARAAAVAEAVLRELATTRYTASDSAHFLIEDVKFISAAAGGSITAAWFGLHRSPNHPDGELHELRDNFLSKNNAALVRLYGTDPISWLWSLSTQMTFTELLDKRLFKNRSYSDINRPGAPLIILNATDLASGDSFSFTPRRFDDICSNLDRLPLSIAVAASAATAPLTSPVGLRDFSDGCQGNLRSGEWIVVDLSNPYTPYLNKSELGDAIYSNDLRHGANPLRAIDYLYLVDGGFADNLGTQSLRSALISPYDDGQVLRAINNGEIQKLVIIVVNARGAPANKFYQDPQQPALDTQMQAVASILSEANTANSETALAALLGELAQAASDAGRKNAKFGGVHIYGITVDYDQIAADTPAHIALRDMAKDVPTSWTLTPVQLQVTEAAARFLLRSHPCYSDLLRDLRAVPMPLETWPAPRETGEQAATIPSPPPPPPPPPPPETAGHTAAIPPPRETAAIPCTTRIEIR